MSFVKKAVRKVFRGAKKFVKKYGKYVAAAAGLFFTSGLAAGGFSAFQGVGDVGSFFGAVGKTMAVGAQAMGGSLGIGQGVSGSLSASTGVAEGTTLGTGALAQSFGASAGTAGAQAAGQAAAQTAAQSGGGGFMGKVGNALQGMTSSPTGQYMLAQGIMGGIQSYMAGKKEDEERERYNKSTVWGGPRKGGQEEFNVSLPQFGQNPPQQEQGDPNMKPFLPQNVQQPYMAARPQNQPAPQQAPQRPGLLSPYLPQQPTYG